MLESWLHVYNDLEILLRVAYLLQKLYGLLAHDLVGVVQLRNEKSEHPSIHLGTCSYQFAQVDSRILSYVLVKFNNRQKPILA